MHTGGAVAAETQAGCYYLRVYPGTLQKYNTGRRPDGKAHYPH